MEVLGWLWWLVAKLVGLAWGIVWFLLGGWVATLAQIAVIALIIFGYKYGWRQAPQELLARAGPFARYLWSWIRTRDAGPMLPRGAAPTNPAMPCRRVRESGDVNLSTLLSVAALGGVLLALVL